MTYTKKNRKDNYIYENGEFKNIFWLFQTKVMNRFLKVMVNVNNILYNYMRLAVGVDIHELSVLYNNVFICR